MKTILNITAMSYRFVIFLFGGSGENKWRQAGRYTRTDYRFIQKGIRKALKEVVG